MNTISVNGEQSNDLHPAVQRALGLGATIPTAAPVLTLIVSGGDAITVQADGQIAIFRPVGFDYFLFACQCKGEIINEIPRLAEYVIGFNLAGSVHRIYRYKNEYFSFSGDKFIQFHSYINPSPMGTNIPTGPSPGSNPECSMHTYPPFIPDEYQHESDRQDLIPDTRPKKDRKK